MMTILVNVAHMSFKTPGCNEGKKRKWQDYEISLSFLQSCLHCMKWEIQPIMNPKYTTETDKEEIFHSFTILQSTQ